MLTQIMVRSKRQGLRHVIRRENRNLAILPLLPIVVRPAGKIKPSGRVVQERMAC
jgi:hypothetical protein